MMYLSRAMVAEIVVELGQRFWYVIFAAPVNNIESLIGVGVVKAKPVFRLEGACGFRRPAQRRGQ